MRDHLELYALGALSPEETAAFERAMRTDPELRREVEEFRRASDQFVHAAPEAEPPASLRVRVVRRARRGLTVVRHDNADWVPTGVPGVEVCVLHRDDESDQQTVLVRMEPGAAYPCHRHAGAEECYVVSGDLKDGSLDMKAGDYSRFEEGTEHGPLSTKGGCTLLVTASIHNELVD